MSSVFIGYIPIPNVARSAMCRSLAVAVGVALVLAATNSSAAPSEEEESLIRRGIALRKARDDVGARVEFQKAYDLGHSPRAAAQLGLAEFALGRWDEAEAHVSEGLRTPGDPWIAKYRDELDQSLATIKAHVGRVEVIGEPDGAEVFINGRPAGTLPLPNSVAVSEGQVDIELRARGHERGSRTVTVSGGQYQRLVMRLERVGGSAAVARDPLAASPVPIAGGAKGHPDSAERPGGAAAPHDESNASASPGQGWRMAKWTSLGLAGASLATGITASVIHSQQASAFGRAHGGGCFDAGGRAVDSSGSPVAECQPSLNALRSARTWQIVGFVGTGVFTAAWLILTLTEPRSADTSGASAQDRTNWTCAPTLASAGATCMLRF